jgi:hypothetical protein
MSFFKLDSTGQGRSASAQPTHKLVSAKAALKKSVGAPLAVA